MAKYVIGIDYGSASVRAAVVDASDGSELASGIYRYEYGVDGNYLDRANPHVVRQSPDDYLKGMELSVRLAIESAGEGFDANAIVGIGIDATGTTVLPVSEVGVPLSADARFADNPNAMIWLWKDHSSTAEAQAITEAARALRPEYIDMVGGVYSSEWFWAKVLHCVRCDPAVYDAAHTWIEVSDWLVFLLTGGGRIDGAVRGMCAASHKALFNPEWGGFPSEEYVRCIPSSRRSSVRSTAAWCATCPPRRAGSAASGRSAWASRPASSSASRRSTPISAASARGFGPAYSSRRSARRRATCTC